MTRLRASATRVLESQVLNDSLQTQKPSRRTEPGWLSAHLFFVDSRSPFSPAADRVLLEIVEPFVRECLRSRWIRRYFFIRFDELGPHLRLRLRGRSEVLAGNVRPALECAARLELETWTDGAGSAQTSRHQLLSHVLWLPYEPEVRRYAGPGGMAAAEEFFRASSKAAFALIRRGGSPGSAERLAQGLLAMTVLLHALSENREQAVALAVSFRRYALDMVRLRTGASQLTWSQAFDAGLDRQPPSLLAAVRTTWEALEADRELPAPFGAYAASLRVLRGRLEALRRRGGLVMPGHTFDTWREVAATLTPSYLHMMNNRLGIPVLQEAYLGHLASQFLAWASGGSDYQPQQ